MGLKITYTNTCDRCGHKAEGYAHYDNGIRYDPWSLEPHCVQPGGYVFDETDEHFYPVEFEHDDVKYTNFLLCEKCYKEYQTSKSDKKKMDEFLGEKFLEYRKTIWLRQEVEE